MFYFYIIFIIIYYNPVFLIIINSDAINIKLLNFYYNLVDEKTTFFIRYGVRLKKSN